MKFRLATAHGPEALTKLRPVLEVTGFLFLTVLKPGLVGISNSLLFPRRVAQIAALPTKNILGVDPQFFHAGDRVSIGLIHC